jgi:hypothetical protein
VTALQQVQERIAALSASIRTERAKPSYADEVKRADAQRANAIRKVAGRKALERFRGQQ